MRFRRTATGITLVLIILIVTVILLCRSSIHPPPPLAINPPPCLIMHMASQKAWFLSTRISRKIFGTPAPLTCHRSLHQGKPITYAVSLANGYSLEQHKQITGRADDLERVITSSSELDDFDFPGTFITYSAKFDDVTLLADIRADCRVTMVECPGVKMDISWRSEPDAA